MAGSQGLGVGEKKKHWLKQSKLPVPYSEYLVGLAYNMATTVNNAASSPKNYAAKVGLNHCHTHIYTHSYIHTYTPGL